jgi:hypothetical protein
MAAKQRKELPARNGFASAFASAFPRREVFRMQRPETHARMPDGLLSQELKVSSDVPEKENGKGDRAEKQREQHPND